MRYLLINTVQLHKRNNKEIDSKKCAYHNSTCIAMLYNLADFSPPSFFRIKLYETLKHTPFGLLFQFGLVERQKHSLMALAKSPLNIVVSLLETNA